MGLLSVLLVFLTWIVYMKKFSKEELAHYDGKNNSSAYIAYNGKVYDVTESFLWKGGKHQVLHNAGMDLTNDLDEAPHGADILNRVPVIGFLVNKEQ